MKNQRYFPGIILIGFGGYFLQQQAQIEFLQQLTGWPTLLMIVGIAFLWQAYGARDHEMIFPGVVLFGFGIHIHVVTHLHIWSDHIGIFVLVMALAYILRYQKTGTGLLHGILFLVLACALLFYDKMIAWLGILESRVSMVGKFWPILLIAVGVYFLMKRKK
jgi:hypothetical protein